MGHTAGRPRNLASNAMVASAPRRVRILVADDHPSIRENLRYLLNDEDDFEVVGVARDGGDALATTIALEPDVVVLDERMPVTPASGPVPQPRGRGLASPPPSCVLCAAVVVSPLGGTHARSFVTPSPTGAASTAAGCGESLDRDRPGIYRPVPGAAGACPVPAAPASIGIGLVL